jgi:hypothetical protein
MDRYTVKKTQMGFTGEKPEVEEDLYRATWSLKFNRMMNVLHKKCSMYLSNLYKSLKKTILKCNFIF